MTGAPAPVSDGGSPGRQERSRTEQRIVSNPLQQLPDILSQLNDAVMVVAMDGQIVYWNAAAERLHGIPAAEILGKHWRDVRLYRTSLGNAADEALIELVRVGSWRREFSYTRSDGQELYIEISASALTDDRGFRTGFVAIVRDMTDRRKL